MQHQTKSCDDELPWFANGAFPLYLAPMAGFTDYAFRELCKMHGADVMVTEFVFADALLMEYRADALWETIDFSEKQRPMGVQLFGADPHTMGDAAALIEERLKPDFIDLNFGCPASRITCMEAGSSMLKNLPKMQTVAHSVAQSCKKTPITAKMRIGWDSGSIVALDAAQCLQEAGMKAIAIHGRTKEQGYRGEADMNVIEEVAAQISIPVIANGNLRSWQDIAALRNGAIRGAMIGRGALGYPWLFREIKAALNGDPVPDTPNLEERWAVLLSYIDLLSAQKRVKTLRAGKENLVWMRPRIQTFTTGMPGGRKLRNELSKVSTVEELKTFAYKHIKTFKNR
jgi:nifR3 family TIM-barrel protein